MLEQMVIPGKSMSDMGELVDSTFKEINQHFLRSGHFFEKTSSNSLCQQLIKWMKALFIDGASQVEHRFECFVPFYSQL